MWFFIGRRYFERVGALERKIMEKSVKSLARVAKIIKNSLQDLANAPKNIEIWRTWAKNCAGSVPRVPKPAQELCKSAPRTAKDATRAPKINETGSPMVVRCAHGGMRGVCGGGGEVNLPSSARVLQKVCMRAGLARRQGAADSNATRIPPGNY